MKHLIKHKFVAAFVLAALLISGCKKYADFQTNPNLPSNSTPALMLTGICYSVFFVDNTSGAFSARHLTYYERSNSASDYSWSEGSFENYNILRQVMRMDSLAKGAGQTQYYGLTKFFRALLFSQMTEIFGDIPYSQALGGNSGNFTPGYDDQESIYKGVLQELEEANALLDDSKGKILGDIIYFGVASQWKKLVNAFKLRLLIHLSNKATNTNLNITDQFQTIIDNPSTYPLMASNDDNAQIVYNTSASNNDNPDFGYLSLSTAISMEEGFVNILKNLQDPRLFAFADPISGQPEGVFSSYAGVNGGLSLVDQTNNSSNASRIASRYYAERVIEPLVMLGYPEQELLIAEAIARGWVTGAGTAQEHYENGITASMNFYGISGADVTTYLAQPSVAYNATDALDLITIQKHIAFFMAGNYEAFFEQRRTGLPVLNVGPGTANGGVVPKRWLYPQTEYDNNLENLQEALDRQFGGDDDVDNEMWILLP